MPNLTIPPQAVPAFWGAIFGAAAVAIIGFGWAGWVTGSSAEKLASERASKAVVSVLTPICVQSFNRGEDVTAKLAELKKVSSWEQGAFISKGGWAAIPGSSTVNTDMAESCAEVIVGQKS